jgi:membrane peptidoglycan carboxypeptidase
VSATSPHVRRKEKRSKKKFKQAENMMAQTTFASDPHTKHAPYFVDWIINQLASKLGDGDYATGFNLLEHNGYNIHTTLDLNLEEYVERAIDQHLNKPDYQYYPLSLRGNQIISSKLNIHSAAVVVLDAKTGEILAMDGGADYDSSDPAVGGQYNIVDPPSWGPDYPAGRPPGTTMLPIDYAAAYTHQGVPTTSILDGPSYLDTDLTDSSDDAALTAENLAGSAAIRTTAQSLGITIPKDVGTNFADGSENISLLQMTAAYQALANQGKIIPPVGLLDIYDRNGHQIYHYNISQTPATQAVPAIVANHITADLSDEPDRADKFGDDQQISFADQDAGCATSLVCKYPVAAQSSNTDETEDGNTTIGYTPDVVVGSWVGNVNGARMSSDTVGSTGALPIWHSVIKRALGWCGPQSTASPYFRSDHVACGPDSHLPFSSQN